MHLDYVLRMDNRRVAGPSFAIKLCGAGRACYRHRVGFRNPNIKWATALERREPMTLGPACL